MLAFQELPKHKVSREITKTQIIFHSAEGFKITDVESFLEAPFCIHFCINCLLDMYIFQNGRW